MMLTESMTDLLSQERRATDLFYSRFLERYPDVRRFFDKIDLREQGVILTMSLRVLTEYYVHRYPALEEYLRLLGKKHALRGIPQGLYSDFRDCLLDTLETFFGESWGPDLESEWTAAINLASDIMMQGADQCGSE